VPLRGVNLAERHRDWVRIGGVLIVPLRGVNLAELHRDWVRIGGVLIVTLLHLVKEIDNRTRATCCVCY
jgi:hypothetical protein